MLHQSVIGPCGKSLGSLHEVSGEDDQGEELVVAGADGCGEQVFSTSYTQFERDAAAYNAAVKKNGGNPPVCKKK